jgi:hypothetical protein
MKALLVALALLPTSASAAPCHIYSIWHFKNAQRCGGNNRPPVVSIAKRATVPAMAPPQAPGPSFDIPLPDPDPATTALKAQLQ